MKILLVAKFFPPANSIASYRLYSFAKYLPEFGIHVDVLTPLRKGNLLLPLDGISIFHPNTEESSVTRFVRKKNFIKDILKYSGIRSFRYYLWSPFYRASKKWSAEFNFSQYDAVMASYGPEDAVHIGYMIHKKTGIPMILDYRDLWLDNLYAGWTPLDRYIIRKIEGKILNSASLITAATQGLKRRIEAEYGKTVYVIYNGFFEDDKTDCYSKLKNNHGVRICYTGSLYGGIQPIHVIFPLLKSNPSISLDIAVQDSIDADLVRELTRKYNVDRQVNLYQNLSNIEAASLQRQADILLFLNRMDGKAECVLSGKLFEYMKARKFILGIGHERDEAKELFERYQLGAYVTRIEKLPAAIREAETWIPPKWEEIAFFSRKRQAEYLSDLIKGAFDRDLGRKG